MLIPSLELEIFKYVFPTSQENRHFESGIFERVQVDPLTITMSSESLTGRMAADQPHKV